MFDLLTAGRTLGLCFQLIYGSWLVIPVGATRLQRWIMTTTQKPSGTKATKVKNNVRKLRTERMMSKAELARRAALSTLTIDRVERGMKARMDTKRKILEALGLKPTDRVMVFGDAEED